jgi:hypothetical protein
VYYVNFKSGTTLRLPDVLDRIRDGSNESFFIKSEKKHILSDVPNGSSAKSGKSITSQGLPQAARDLLTHDLYYLRRGMQPSNSGVLPPASAENEPWEPGELIDDVFDTLTKALEIAADKAPLVLALDQLEKIESPALLQLVNSFFKSVTQKTEFVRVIVTSQATDLKKEGWSEEVIDKAVKVPLREIRIEEFRPLAREFLQHNGYDFDGLTEIIDATVAFMAGRSETSWSPVRLQKLKAYLE